MGHDSAIFALPGGAADLEPVLRDDADGAASSPPEPALQSVLGTVLLAIADAGLRDGLCAALDGAGWSTRSASLGAPVVAMVTGDRADIVLLDGDLTDVSGFEVCRMLRAAPRAPFVLMLVTGGDDVRERALEFGADDCVSKPCGTYELVLRAAALGRRLPQRRNAPRQLRIGRIRIDADLQRVEVDGTPVSLTVTEFRILLQLAYAEGRALSRDVLRGRVWQAGTVVNERVIDTHIRRLRAKLGGARLHVETVHRSGYRLRP